MPRTTTSMANDVVHDVEVKQEPTIFIDEHVMLCLSNDSLFINLGDLLNDDGALPSYPSISLPIVLLGLHEVLPSIPPFTFASTSFVLSVVDCFQSMFWAPHTTFNIHFLDYDTLLIF